MNKIIGIILIYLCAVTHTGAGTINKDKFQSHEDIIKAASDFVSFSMGDNKDNIKVSFKSLDRRLQLSKCADPLIAFWPPGAKIAGHTTVGIRCNDNNKPWKIFITASIKQFAEVWVTKASVARGTLISKENSILDWREISHVNTQYYSHEQSPVGLIAKRPLRMGDILNTQALEKPLAVKRGDKVIVIARKNGLEIRATATALSSAAEGDRLKVRNISSDKVMEGTLFENSIVYVNI